ncbi:MAG: DUF3579 domain-containing protein [Methylophilaceae bacterium]|jgi:hypothetical protein|nr:DUF3579 domain-containing protein [Methylophilaceae bacterium]
MKNTSEEIIIQSLTREGKRFRPSDWVDRICSSYAKFGEDRKLRYSPYLKPKIIDGVRCLAVGMQLRTANQDRFEELMQFAEENNLSILNSEGESIEIPKSDLQVST